jgi:hypothetical protein
MNIQCIIEMSGQNKIIEDGNKLKSKIIQTNKLSVTDPTTHEPDVSTIKLYVEIETMQNKAE